MAKLDITKRPRKALSASEREELFREFKLGIFALVALVILVVTLCWDQDAGPGSEQPAEADSTPALVRVVWNPTGRQGGISPDRIPQRPASVQTEAQRPAGPAREDRDREQARPQQRPEPENQRQPVEQQPRREVRPKYRNYVVKRRDTLWKIAKVEMGDGKFWTRIREANPSLRNSNKLRPGQVLRIPNRSEDFTAGAPSGILANGSGDGSLLLSSPTQSP